LCAREAVKRMSTRHSGQGGVMRFMAAIGRSLLHHGDDLRDRRWTVGERIGVQSGTLRLNPKTEIEDKTQIIQIHR
jgi:hypothetical protein